MRSYPLFQLEDANGVYFEYAQELELAQREDDGDLSPVSEFGFHSGDLVDVLLHFDVFVRDGRAQVHLALESVVLLKTAEQMQVVSGRETLSLDERLRSCSVQITMPTLAAVPQEAAPEAAPVRRRGRIYRAADVEAGNSEAAGSGDASTSPIPGDTQEVQAGAEAVEPDDGVVEEVDADDAVDDSMME